MMSIYPYLIAFAVIVLFALIATLMVGYSKSNKEGNPGYDQKTDAKWFRLTSFYAILIMIGIGIILFVIFK